MFLLIFPSSLLAGLINQQVGFGPKSSLWSFIVIKACVFARQLIRSFSAISFASRLISCSRSFGAFLYVLVMFSLRIFLCSSGFCSEILLVLSAKTRMLGDALIFFTSSFNLSWNSSFIFLSSRFFTMSITSFSKFFISSHCGGHFLVLNP